MRSSHYPEIVLVNGVNRQLVLGEMQPNPDDRVVFGHSITTQGDVANVIDWVKKDLILANRPRYGEAVQSHV
jgi:hypothetical protein